MDLRQVLSGITLKSELPEALASCAITSLEYDSRKAGPGTLFFAFPGALVDGRTFAADAISRGAVAVVSELPPLEQFEGPWIQVAHGREALALASGNFFAHPDRRLRITGITGTNGKTTTSYLVDSVLREAGNTTGIIGTIEYRLGAKVLRAVNTTPESLDLFRFFSELEEIGGTHAIMETSSHALALRRAYGIQYHTAIFTNLTRDHLDFHHTMAEYFAAKQLLFTGHGAAAPRYGVINHDDRYGRELTIHPDTEVLTYGLEEGAQARAHKVSSGFDGLRFVIHFAGRTYPVESPLVGKINVYNLLAAWCAGVSHEIAPEVIARGLAALRSVPGRFERVEMGQPFLVLVDFAHTDDALRNAISAARAITKKRVITMFGCGGDRDRTKRPLMGMVAAELSDYVVLTSDNPRSEDPLAIIADALVGVRRFDTPHVVEPDRALAIRRAIDQAGPGDVVLLAGKGHETYQVLKDKTIAFDDRAVARDILRGFGYAPKER